VRSDVYIDNRGALINKKPSCATNVREPQCTVGPLTTARVGGRVASNTIPIMACGNDAVLTESSLPVEFGEFDKGTPLADSFSSGPRDPATNAAPIIGGSATGPAAWFGPWNNTLQDYRAFGPVHGGRRKGTCNVVFVDGSVKTFTDENGDGLLNNGFPTSSATGFADDAIELAPAEIHSGWTLDANRLR